jgi:hypothetical protein
MGANDLLAYRAGPEGRVSDPQGHASEKWLRCSAPNYALTKGGSIGKAFADRITPLATRLRFLRRGRRAVRRCCKGGPP